MATRSSILAWKIPWMEEPGGSESIGLQSDTTERTQTHIQTCYHVSGVCVCERMCFDTYMSTESKMLSKINTIILYTTKEKYADIKLGHIIDCKIDYY